MRMSSLQRSLFNAVPIDFESTQLQTLFTHQAIVKIMKGDKTKAELIGTSFPEVSRQAMCSFPTSYLLVTSDLFMVNMIWSDLTESQAVEIKQLAASVISKTQGAGAASFHFTPIIGLPQRSAIKHIIINSLLSGNDSTFVLTRFFFLILQLKLPPENAMAKQLQQT